MSGCVDLKGACGVLAEMAEWSAMGFMEALDEPWPLPYGRAFLRLYENMEIQVPAERWLIPCEPMPRVRDRHSHQVWSPVGQILNLNHSSGWGVATDVVEQRKQQFPQHAKQLDAIAATLRGRLRYFGGYTHSNPDIRRVVSEGFVAMCAELEEELRALASEGEAADPRERNLLLALKDYADGVSAFHRRAVTAVADAAASADGERGVRLECIRDALAHGFLHPARSFLEGLLAVNFCWMLDGCDSIGRVDQVLGALYEQDLADGRLDLAFVRELLDEWFRMFDAFNGWNLQVGGYTPAGMDGTNALTLELIAACGRQRLLRPNVAFRVTRETPDEALVAALRVLREGGGRPPFYNDDLYVETLLGMDLGLTTEDAREIGFGGCTETMIAGLSNVGSLEGSLNLAKAMELAVHDGRDPVTGVQMGPHTGSFADFVDFEEFCQAVRRQIQYMTDAFVARNQVELARRFHEGDPKLYRTFFTRDCVKRRKSFEAGGARYNWCVVSYQGIANLIDSLAAIRRCVFDDQSVGATELIAALKADFAGYGELRRWLEGAPRFGNDDPYVDEPGAAMIEYAWRQLYEHETPRGGRYLASCILFVTYQGAGATVGATPDGRGAGEVLTDSIGPAQGRDRSGPTAMLHSINRLPLHLAIGTPVLNVRFQKQLLSDTGSLKALVGLIRAFFAEGGMQLQISVLSRDEMLAAQEDPDAHRDLIVRIGGYSEYFVRLNRQLQDSVISRTEYAL